MLCVQSKLDGRRKQADAQVRLYTPASENRRGSDDRGQHDEAEREREEEGRKGHRREKERKRKEEKGCAIVKLKES